MPVKKGILCKLYRNTGTYGAPVWTEVDVIKDFKVAADWDKGEAGSRATRVKQSVKTVLDLSWSGTFKNDGSAGAEALVDALLTDAVLDLLILNGAKDENGARGFRCDCQVFGGSEDQGPTALVYPEVTIVPTDSANPPKAVKVAAGAPTFSAITGAALTFA